jgi:WD40 repeat protein
MTLWDVHTGKFLHEIKAHPEHVGCLAFSPNGRVLASAVRHEGTIRLWDVATGRPLTGTESHLAPIASFDISADGKLAVTASRDRTARFWDLATGKEVRRLGLGFDNPAVGLSPDGKLLATGGRRFLDAATGAEIRKFAGDRMYHFKRLIYSPDGTKLIGDGSGELNCLWDVASGNVLREFRGAGVWSAAFSADGKAVAVGLEENIEIWDLAADQLLRRLGEEPMRKRYSSGFSQLAFSPDGSLLAAGLRRNGGGDQRAPKDGGIRVYEVATGKVRYFFDGHQAYVSAVAFSPDGRFLASGGDDKTVRLWDMAAGRERHVFRGHSGSVTAVKFTPYGGAVVSSSADATVLVWNVPLK